MRTLLDIFAIWPMPMLWVAAVGALFMRRRSGRAAVAMAVLLLLIGSLPATGRVLLGPLTTAAPLYGTARTGSQQPEAVAIVVLLGGAYVDPDGRWWPLPGSVRRTVLGRQLQQATGLPIILSGGAPLPGQIPETETVASSVALPADKTILDSTSHDTFESARAVARILAERFPAAARLRVVLVTDPSHVARAGAAMRRFDIDSVAVPVIAPQDAEPPAGPRLLDFVPSGRGLGAVRRAWREYVGIAWYVLSGRVRLRDLSPHG